MNQQRVTTLPPGPTSSVPRLKLSGSSAVFTGLRDASLSDWSMFVYRNGVISKYRSVINRLETWQWIYGYIFVGVMVFKVRISYGNPCDHLDRENIIQIWQYIVYFLLGLCGPVFTQNSACV